MIPGDDFFAFLGHRLIAPWTSDSREQNETLVEAAAAAAGRFAAGGYSAVYDGVVGPWMLDRFARTSGTDLLHYAILMPSVDRCLDQVAGRIDHAFRDPDATRHMHDEFAKAEIAPRHVLRDPPHDPEQVTALLLSALRSGDLWCEPEP